jgi:hypothetical protein
VEAVDSMGAGVEIVSQIAGDRTACNSTTQNNVSLTRASPEAEQCHLVDHIED